MPEPDQVGDLQVSQDMTFQRRAWRVQRVGWLVMALVVVAACAGLLGDGPLARAEVETSDGTLRVEYDRFVRHREPTDLSVTVTGAASIGDEVRLVLPRRYVSSLQIESVYPEPESVEVGPDDNVFVFTARQAAPITIVFNVMHEGLGSQRASIRLESGTPATFNQFVYP